MSEDDVQQQQSRIKELIARGKEQGYLTYAEVNDHLPDDISDPDQVEDIIQMINDVGIRVYETAPDADTLLMTDGDNSAADEIAAAEAAAALVAVETETGRTTDPVRMYMREMGTVELLTREGEIVIAKRIEEGIRELMHALAYWPGAVEHLLNEYALVAKEERRLAEVIIGWLDPVEEIPVALVDEDAEIEVPVVGAKPAGEDDEEGGAEEEEEAISGVDPEEAKVRFEELAKQHEKAVKTLSKHGYGSKQAEKELFALGELFKFFKIPPRQFDPIYNKARDALNSVRRHERLIMDLCTRKAQMQRKTFIKEFPGNENNLEWLPDLLKGKVESADKLERVLPDVQSAQQVLLQIEAETNLSLTSIKDINRRMSIGEARARRAKKEMVEANLRLVISIAKK
jgi:RNA polymerase primary sigma factor